MTSGRETKWALFLQPQNPHEAQRGIDYNGKRISDMHRMRWEIY